MSENLTVSPRAQAITGLKQYIRDRVLATGEPLPSQRELAEALGVSQPTIRRALKVLESEGWVGPQRGYIRMVAESRGRAPTVPLLDDCILVLGAERMDGEVPMPGMLPAVQAALQEEIANQGYHAMLFNPTAQPLEALARKLAAQPAGLAIPEFWQSREESAGLTRLLERSETPVVVYGHEVKGESFDRVSSDHVAGARLLTEELIRRGRRRILQLLPGSKDAFWIRQRREGYLQAMAAHGLAAMPTRYISEQDRLAGDLRDNYDAKGRFLAGQIADAVLDDEPVDGILATNDWEVAPLHLALRYLRKEPGEDVLVAGYDNVWHDSFLPTLEAVPPAATIDKLNRELGLEMIRLLHARINGELGTTPVRRNIVPKLIAV